MPEQAVKKPFSYLSQWRTRLLLFLAVFGPATITAMADNDAGGVSTYSIAGAKLGYPILFILLIVTILLGITQEMGIRLALVTRKGLGDLIREHYGIRVSALIFLCLFIANMGTIIVDLAAVKTMALLLHLPAIPCLLLMILVIYFFVTKGNYKMTQNIMLFSCLFYLTYIFSAFKARPDWGLALSNVFFPNGIEFSHQYLKDFIFIGMAVLGTTITPWGQFFISSFSSDKHIDVAQLHYSQFEAYWGAFLTDFFSFFMIVATAATLYVNKIPLLNGADAALAIKPFAGELAGALFAIGILDAGFMGVVVVSLSTAYAFSEFFGLSGGLDSTFQKGPTFYTLFLIQLIIAGGAVMLPGVSLFKLAITTQVINAMVLPLVFYYLIKLTNDRRIMGKHANNAFQSYFTAVGTVAITLASLITIIALFTHF